MPDETEEPPTDPYEFRKRASFAEAEGIRGPPPQLKLKEVSRELRAKLWNVLYSNLKESCIAYGDRVRLTGPWFDILFYLHVNVQFHMADEFSNDGGYHAERIKKLILNGSYIDIFDFIQTALRNHQNKWMLSAQISDALESSRAAYRILDVDTIIPISSETDFETVGRALADVSKHEFNGARAHLKTAVSKLTTGDFAGSIRESISAVESVARKLATSSSLSESLVILENKFEIHNALKRGFNAIYGYTSDEKGIRHPLIDEPNAKVDEADALFMIGACSAFVSYLIFKTNGSSKGR